MAEHPDNRLWCWSRTPDGPFHGPATDEGAAVVDALTDPTAPLVPTGQPWVYVGRCAPALASSFLADADELIISARITAYDMDRDGPHSLSRPSEWLGTVTATEHADLTERLARAFDDWASHHHLHPQFFRVQDVRALTFAEADAVGTQYARALLFVMGNGAG